MEFTPPVNFDRNATSTRNIYFLRCGEFLKIGIAGDIEQRIRGFKIGNPHSIKLEAYRTVPRALCVQIEKAVHAALAHRHHEGEWFRVGKAEALAIADPLIKKATATVRRWNAAADDALEREYTVQVAQEIGKFMDQQTDQNR